MEQNYWWKISTAHHNFGSQQVKVAVQSCLACWKTGIIAVLQNITISQLV